MAFKTKREEVRRAVQLRYKLHARGDQRLSLCGLCRLSAFPLISQYRGPKRGQKVWVGAILASSLDGDCGPCAQLTLDMALEAGAPEEELRACLQGDAEHAGDIGLGFRFAQAAIASDVEADALGAEIKLKYGQQAVVAAAFAAASGRMYPVLKRGLGHGAACQKLRIGISEFPVKKAA